MAWDDCDQDVGFVCDRHFSEVRSNRRQQRAEMISKARHAKIVLLDVLLILPFVCWIFWRNGWPFENAEDILAEVIFFEFLPVTPIRIIIAKHGDRLR